MKKLHLLSLAFCCAALLPARAQQTETKKSTTMQTQASPKIPLQSFFNAFGKGDLEGVLRSFTDDCSIIAVRDGERTASGLYGTYKGQAGVRAFLSTLGATFDTKAFSVAHVV